MLLNETPGVEGCSVCLFQELLVSQSVIGESVQRAFKV
uniref:Uncharacterized protein n=1 Tax=Anguilla anguilla TaxID=7936 RepID=A0A0E9THU7_ANGAN